MKKDNKIPRDIWRGMFDSSMISCKGANTESITLRDHFALEAMKVVYDKVIMRRMSWKDRLKKMLGMRYYVIFSIKANNGDVAKVPYDLADAMMDKRERKV